MYCRLEAKLQLEGNTNSRTHLYSQYADALGTGIRLTDDKRNFTKYEGRRICRSNAVGIWRKQSSQKIL